MCIKGAWLSFICWTFSHLFIYPFLCSISQTPYHYLLKSFHVFCKHIGKDFHTIFWKSFICGKVYKMMGLKKNHLGEHWGLLEKNKCFSVLISLIVKLYSNYSNNIKKYEVYGKTLKIQDWNKLMKAIWTALYLQVS